MKTIKQEDYRGYQISVQVEYKETPAGRTEEKLGVGGAMMSSYKGSRERVDITSTTYKLSGEFLILETVENAYVETPPENRKDLYERLTKKVDEVYNNAKKEIDKKEREKEMTDGLPESLLRGYSSGGLTGEVGRLAVLHNDFVLNKGEAEKLFQSAKMFGQNISEVLNSYVEFAKQEQQGDKAIELGGLEASVFNVNVELNAGKSTRTAHSVAQEITKRLSEIKFS